MKKLLFCVIGMLSFGAVVAQENAVKLNPLSFFGGSDLFSYERKLSTHSSGIIGAGFSSYSFGSENYTSAGGELQYRYSFTEAIEGWYAGAQVGFTSGKVKIDDNFYGFGNQASPSSYETKFSSVKAGAKGGYQWAWNSGFVLDLNLGFGYSSFKYDDNNGNFSTLKGSGILPNLGFALGYAF